VLGVLPEKLCGPAKPRAVRGAARKAARRAGR
jgi:hypothetical protein